MKHVLPVFILLWCASPAQADCNTGEISKALDSDLTSFTPKEFEVSDVSSTEGGVWHVYREKDGRLHTITRGDYGESGRQETRLSVVNKSIYGIAASRVDYLRHAFVEEAGPNGDARRTTDYFYICDGELLLPKQDVSMVDVDAYTKAGKDALALMRDHADIAKFTIGLKR